MKLPNQVKPILRTTLVGIHASKMNNVNPQQALFTTGIPSTATFFPGLLPEFGLSLRLYCLPGPGDGGFQCVVFG
jgi:hypothetical protein